MKQEAKVSAARGILAPGSSLSHQQALHVPRNPYGPQLHDPSNIYSTGQQYLQQQQFLQQPLRNTAVPQGHAPYSSTPIAQSSAAYRMQQPANVVLSQQGYGQPQPLQQPYSNIPDSRKRKAEALQVVHRLLVACTLQDLVTQCHRSGALGAIWC